MYTDFSSKLLYRQSTLSEEEHEVISSVHALTWRHPNSTANITTRARMTIVCNFSDPSIANIIAANIEVWKENGWVSFEDCFDEAFSSRCICSEDIESKCLEMLELFFVGSLRDKEEQPFDLSPGPAPKRKKSTKPPFGAVKPKDKKEPDFDWI